MKNLFHKQLFIYLLSIVFIYIGCSHSSQFSKKPGKTCLVLSVGGLKGIAHIGAIDALKKLNIKIDCVYGNSAGSLVGALYSFDPKSNLKKESKKLLSEYLEKTEKDKFGSASRGFIFGAILTFFSGGIFGWETIITSTVLGWDDVDEINLKRTENILNKYFYKQNIEDLSIEFATGYQENNENGIVMKTASKGNLSSAISKSISNPLIFNENVKQMKYFDPGSDRVAATPIFDAIQHFKPTKVIAINVTSESAMYFEIKNVEVIEIMVNAVDSSENEVRGFSQLIEKNYNIGYNTVIKFLEE